MLFEVAAYYRVLFYLHVSFYRVGLMRGYLRRVGLLFIEGFYAVDGFFCSFRCFLLNNMYLLNEVRNTLLRRDIFLEIRRIALFDL